MSPRPTWDEYGLALAQTVALRADCTRRKVGAVILGPDHRVRGAGYNGAPSGVPGCASSGACPRGLSTVAAYSNYDNCIAIHAEANALLHGKHEGGTMYVTDAPCAGCEKLLRGSGIVRVVWPEGEMKV